jgi:hypothetical protein
VLPDFFCRLALLEEVPFLQEEVSSLRINVLHMHENEKTVREVSSPLQEVTETRAGSYRNACRKSRKDLQEVPKPLQGPTEMRAGSLEKACRRCRNRCRNLPKRVQEVTRTPQKDTKTCARSGHFVAACRTAIDLELEHTSE